MKVACDSSIEALSMSASRRRVDYVVSVYAYMRVPVCMCHTLHGVRPVKSHIGAEAASPLWERKEGEMIQ